MFIQGGTFIPDSRVTTNGTGLSKWFVRMASEIFERETTTNVLHSPFCVTFRESYKIEESKSKFDTYLQVTLPYIKYCRPLKFTFRFLDSNEWAAHYLQMHMLSQTFETVRRGILFFRWTSKTHSKWFKKLQSWELLRLS